MKRWFVLKNDALSWFQSSSVRIVKLPTSYQDLYELKDPYFPHGVVDLKYAVSCEPTGDKDIHLRTNQKNVLLSADSPPAETNGSKRSARYELLSVVVSTKHAIFFNR